MLSLIAEQSDKLEISFMARSGMGLVPQNTRFMEKVVIFVRDLSAIL